MRTHYPRRLLTLTGFLAAVVILLIAFGGAGTTSGQTPRTPTPTVTPTRTAVAAPLIQPAQSGGSAAPALDNDTAVRTVLPDDLSGSATLPGKWARADMPDAPGGYVIFISTIFPRVGSRGVTYYLLVNYLQWDGFQWLIGDPNAGGTALSGDDAWLAANLTDITATPSPAGQTWRVFTVAYSGDGLVSPTLSRTETVIEIYDLSLNTEWSRTDFLRETDTSDPTGVEQRAEDVNWTFADVDGDGVDELIATVTDSDTVTAPDGSASNTNSATTTEIWKWRNGAFALQSSRPAGNQSGGNQSGGNQGTGGASTPAAAPTTRPTPQAPASRTTPTAPLSAPTQGVPTPGSSSPVPTPTGTASGSGSGRGPAG